ncbi:hypothetical protein [Mesoflavibacter zeaxanthinifaciens]|uniref:hypothetical protein n=1 Tax=Mesoflavibacter zeaxanthinifaciens TaxID=393060 RepID=UPI0024398F9F|nr:hypothetical protein [Mesoflavibacter zeaxanthinifaciens]
MKTNKGTIVEWYSAERMHEMSKNWLSDLNFIKDEQVFLEELITNYTQKILEEESLTRAQTATTALYRTKRGCEKLINQIVQHENDLRLMVDGKDEIEKETQYKEEHREITGVISSFYHDYKAVKFEIFELIKDIIKIDKMAHLIK